MNLDGFDANREQEWRGDQGGVVPPGEYLCVIDSTEEKEVRGKPHCRRLEIVFQVTEGPQTGSNIYTSLNLVNDNETAVKIARAELAAICKAVGKPSPKSSEELHDSMLVLKVKVEERNDKPGAYRNVVTGYKSGRYAPAKAEPASGDAPWEKTPF